MGGVAPDERSTAGRSRTLAGRALVVLATVAAVVAVAAIYLRRYPDGAPVLVRDVTYYLWRSRLVSERGLHALASWQPAAAAFRPVRTGYPVLLGLLHVSDITTVVLATRAVAAVAVGLAAGAFAREVLGERWFAFPVFVFAVGASIQLARTSVGYLDNLVVDAVLLTAGVAALVGVTGRRGRLLAVVAMGAAMLIHWFFALLFLALLLGVVLVFLPGSIRATRSGTPVSATPSWRLGSVVAGSAVACAVAAVVAPALPTKLPPIRGRNGGRASSGPLWLPQTLPLAMAGAVPLAWARPTTRRAGFVFAVLWAASVPLGMVISAALPGSLGLKTFRIGSFALGIPLLVAAAAVGVVALPRWVWLRVAGAAAAGTVLVVLFLHSATVARSVIEGPVLPDLEQVRVAAPYLEQAAGDRPVVFLSSGPSPRMLDAVARSEVPVDEATDVWIYPGSIDDLERGVPSTSVRLRVREESAKWLAEAWPPDPRTVLDRDPIVLYLSGFNPLIGQPDGAAAFAPGVFIVRGPAPANVPSSSPAVPGPGRVRWAVVWMLLLLFAVGSGWAVAFLDASWACRAAIAPAVGVVALVVTGSALGRIGVDAVGAVRWLEVAGTAALGWAAAAWTLTRGRPSLPRPRPPRRQAIETREPTSQARLS